VEIPTRSDLESAALVVPTDLSEQCRYNWLRKPALEAGDCSAKSERLLGLLGAQVSGGCRLPVRTVPDSVARLPARPPEPTEMPPLRPPGTRAIGLRMRDIRRAPRLSTPPPGHVAPRGHIPWDGSAVPGDLAHLDPFLPSSHSLLLKASYLLLTLVSALTGTRDFHINTQGVNFGAFTVNSHDSLIFMKLQ
jgi:hypothetical protein